MSGSNALSHSLWPFTCEIAFSSVASGFNSLGPACLSVGSAITHNYLSLSLMWVLSKPNKLNFKCTSHHKCTHFSNVVYSVSMTVYAKITSSFEMGIYYVLYMVTSFCQYSLLKLLIIGQHQAFVSFTCACNCFKLSLNAFS